MNEQFVFWAVMLYSAVVG